MVNRALPIKATMSILRHNMPQPDIQRIPLIYMQSLVLAVARL